MSESRTLYVGNLSHQITESFMGILFGQMGTCMGCKMIYEPGQDPYCFVEFSDHQSASNALATMNGREVMGKAIKVNWATSPNSKNSQEMARGRVDTSDHFHIFCGDLSSDIETKQLREAFHAFGEISDCKVICDLASGKSKGYGFISFINKEDAQRAINEMNGAWLGSRAIRTNWATRKPPAPVERGRQRQPQKLNYNDVFAQASATNTTVYIGGIQEGLQDDLLSPHFEQYGPIAEIRCFADKGFAFVRLNSKESAAQAIVGLNGSEIGGYTVRCSWGKESSDAFVPGMGSNNGAMQQSYNSQGMGQPQSTQQVAQQAANWGANNNFQQWGQQQPWGQQQQWGQQQWGQGQQWGQQQQQWGGGDGSWQQQQPQQGYQQPQQGYQQQGNYNY
ncbi:cytotoxic granule associated RNA binding protein TIA1-like isoform X2 [Watersipora subatra]|uniref:cytotoxic granule associated RNA binding protein TIA1-like isoform X2 n=1 Tax=Watersipora subatra TaxID=2589382 RepID=UPI00355B2E17